MGRGAFWKLGSDLLGRALQYVLLWVAARSLGRADFGDFTFALSVGLMLAQVADFGLQLFVQRELARLTIPGAVAPPYFTDEAAAGRLVGGGLSIKAVLAMVALGLMVGLVLIEPVGNKGALLLVGVSAILGTMLEYLSYCFRALRRLQYEAMAAIVGRAVNLLLGVGLIIAGAGVWGLAVAGNLAMLAAIVFSYTRLTGYVRPSWRPDWGYWREALGQPTAIGVGVVFSIISFRVDNLLIPPILGPRQASEALGLYNVAYKLFEPSQVLPGVLLAATFPLMARVGQGSQGSGIGDQGSVRELRQLLGQNVRILLMLGIGVSLGMMAFASPVLQVLYGGEYGPSAPVLQVLALACLPMYLNYLLTHVLIAMDRPRLFAYFTLLALFVNVLANLALIPTLGIVGAAWATVATEVVLLALCATAVTRHLRNVPAATMAEALPERGVGGLL